MFHLIASLYLSGIYKEIDCWTNYPSHNVGDSTNPVMESIIKKFTQEVKRKVSGVVSETCTTSEDSGSSK
jgi:hypothetical protein